MSIISVNKDVEKICVINKMVLPEALDDQEMMQITDFFKKEIGVLIWKNMK